MAWILVSFWLIVASLLSRVQKQARQVQEVFPNTLMEIILEDLRVTNSVELTIENIVEGRLAAEASVSNIFDGEGAYADIMSVICWKLGAIGWTGAWGQDYSK